MHHANAYCYFGTEYPETLIAIRLPNATTTPPCVEYCHFAWLHIISRCTLLRPPSTTPLLHTHTPQTAEDTAVAAARGRAVPPSTAPVNVATASTALPPSTAPAGARGHTICMAYNPLDAAVEDMYVPGKALRTQGLMHDYPQCH
jgi:hypothetical protein